MYLFLGFLDIGLIAVITAPLWLRKLNQWFFHIKGEKWNKLMKTLRALHKPLALALLVIIPIHGWLALGGLRLHTGLIAWAEALAAGVLGLVYWRSKKKPKQLLMWHRICALIFVILVIVHLLFPNLLYTLMN